MTKIKMLKVLVLIFVVLALALFGCTHQFDDDPPEERGEFPMPEIKEISIWGGAQNATVARALEEGFALDHPEFTLEINLTHVAPYTLAPRIAAGTQPDLIQTHDIKVYFYRQMIQSMEPFIELDGNFYRDDFHHSIFTFNLIDGDMWAFTASQVPYMIKFNKTMFEALQNYIA